MIVGAARFRRRQGVSLPLFVSAAAANSGAALAYPAGSATDFAVLIIWSVGAPGTPAGWTVSATISTSGGAYPHIRVLTQIVGASTTVTVPGTSGRGVLLRYSNASALGTAGTKATGTGSPLSLPSINPAVTSSVVLACTHDTDTNTLGTPSGYTLRHSGAGNGNTSIAEMAYGSTAATGTVDVTQGGAGAADGFLVEVKV